MKYHKTFLSNIFFYSFLSYSVSANSALINSLTITDWNMTSSGIEYPWDYKNTFIPEIIMGTYQGSPTFLPNGEVDFSTAILGGSIFCSAGGGCTSMGVFTSPSYGNAPSGDITNDTLFLDFSSWAMYVSNPYIGGETYSSNIESTGSAPVNQWSTPVITTFDPLTNFFTADWDYRDTRSFTGDPSTIYSWHLEGYVHAVPLPASGLLFSFGLVTLLGFKKYSNKTVKLAQKARLDR